MNYKYIFKGLNCCSDSSISYHYMYPHDMKQLFEIEKKYNFETKFKDIVNELNF